MITYLEQLAAEGGRAPYKRLSVSIADSIGTVTMADPATLNAFGIGMTSELRHVLGALSLDPAVRAIILTGSGAAFSAGADMRQMAEGQLSPAEQFEFIRHEFAGVINAIARCDKPVIAAVNGHAMGVGFFAALSCDMILAAPSARFGTAYIKLGLVPLGISYMLARTLGYVRAFEYCALGHTFTAQSLADLGLINAVAAEGQLLAEAQAVAARLAAGPGRALAFTKQVLRHAAYPGLDEHLIIGEAIQPLCLASADHREAVTAFAEKRSPRFDGS